MIWLKIKHFVLKHGRPSSSFNGRTKANILAHIIDQGKRPQINLNLASSLEANARLADRVFAPKVKKNTAYLTFSFWFAKCLTPMIRASDASFVDSGGSTMMLMMLKHQGPTLEGPPQRAP